MQVGLEAESELQERMRRRWSWERRQWTRLEGSLARHKMAPAADNKLMEIMIIMRMRVASERKKKKRENNK